VARLGEDLAVKANIRCGAFALCAMALFSFPHGAKAVPVNVTVVTDDAITVPIDIAPPAPLSFTGTVFTNLTGSVVSPSEYLSPFGDNTSHFSAIEGPPVFGPSSGTYSLGTGNAFRIFWGSVDAYNSIAFYNGSTLVGSIVGTDLYAVPPQAGHDLVTLLVAGTFDTVVLSSDLAAFEFSNVQVACGPGFQECAPVQATPLPGALPLLASGIAGFGGLFGWRKRRRPAGKALAA
jgi:hypothetical protein